MGSASCGCPTSPCEVVRGLVSKRRMQPALVVVSPPVGDDSPCNPKAFKPLGVETFFPHPTGEAFAERFLNGLAGVDVLHVESAKINGFDPELYLKLAALESIAGRPIPLPHQLG